MPEFVIVILGILLAVTVGVALQYYRILRLAKKEYERAKDALEDVVLSFDRQLQRESDRSEATRYKVEAMASKADATSQRLNSLEKAAQVIELRFNSTLQVMAAESNRTEELNKKVEELTASQSALSNKVSHIDEETRHLLAIPEPNVQAAIPIKRDRALSPLTETELSVLEMLASEGSRTAPEIKDRVKLSREHTARLMKKLYEGGYLERDTGKIPFRYSVKKEMAAILKKGENETA